MRAPSPGIRLTKSDAAIVKGMLVRRDRQSDIASYFGVNGGRIAEISKGKKFAAVEPAPAYALPPKGPYIYGKLHRSMKQAMASIEQDLASGNTSAAKATVKNALKDL